MKRKYASEPPAFESISLHRKMRGMGLKESKYVPLCCLALLNIQYTLHHSYEQQYHQMKNYEFKLFSQW